MPQQADGGTAQTLGPGGGQAPAPRLRVGLIGLGCAKALVDAEVMMGRLATEHDLVGELEAADVVVINTCAFIEAARRESMEAIAEMAARKRQGLLRHVLVTGCLAQRHAPELARALPEVDAFVGTTAERELAPLLREIAAGAAGATAPASPRRPPARLPMAGRPAAARRQPARNAGRRQHGAHAPAGPRPELASGAGPRIVVRDPSLAYGPETARLRLTPRHYAYLRVAEGCNHTCTFCAIPSFRGRFRSKRREDLLAEARELVADGARELILIAEDTNQWGQDLGDGSSLADLLVELAAIEQLAWIRILYAYPAYFPDPLLEAIAGLDKVCKYIDMPLQHISDPILRAMRRPSRARTERLLERLRERIPGLVLRTTVICGFPGETEQHHQELLAFIRSFGFDRLGAFAYSEEQGTPAAAMADQVPPAVRERRRREVMEVQQEVAFARNRARVGSVLRAIIDEPAASAERTARTHWLGRTEGDAPEIDGTIRLRAPAGSRLVAGQLVRARVTASLGYDLEGAVIEPIPLR
ncbi:MAG: hypothetical protein KatS3mg102_1278 [Planctomycetota bacterium]|nr:MAG: hypothetical protein KatS3mg102_1278 [Planctomycetota bacterium]